MLLGELPGVFHELVLVVVHVDDHQVEGPQRALGVLLALDSQVYLRQAGQDIADLDQLLLAYAGSRSVHDALVDVQLLIVAGEDEDVLLPDLVCRAQREVVLPDELPLLPVVQRVDEQLERLVVGPLVVYLLAQLQNRAKLSLALVRRPREHLAGHALPVRPVVLGPLHHELCKLRFIFMRPLLHR